MGLFIGLLLIITAGFFVSAVLLFSIESFRENEARAGWILLSAVFILLALYMLVFFSGNIPALWIFAISPWLIMILLFWPAGSNREGDKGPDPRGQIDERDIMFSRRLLKEGSRRYRKYYSQNPEKKESDDRSRAKPGLLSPRSQYYHPLQFAAANASFTAVEALVPAIDKPATAEKVKIEAAALSTFLKGWARKLGALDLGITLLKTEHLYSYRGREHNYGKKVDKRHKYAIAFTVEMDKEMIDRAPLGPAVMESAGRYMHAGSVAVQIAAFIRELGYDATAHIDGHYELVAPLVARDAGLGEIGRMGLLITAKEGPRVRIGVVTTSMEMKEDTVKRDLSVTEFCDICKKCANNCPAAAIPSGEQKMINGIKRWQINQEKCYDYWCIAGTDCGRCIAVCPYSHPDNYLHRLVRLGVRRSALFRKIAVPLDDFFYAKKPISRKPLKWMNP